MKLSLIMLSLKKSARHSLFALIAIIAASWLSACNDEDISKLSNEIPSGSSANANFDDGSTHGWVANGLWHITSRRSVSGANSLWYGDEATGNYDSPPASAHSGTFSRTIDLTNITSMNYDYFYEGECLNGTPATACGPDIFILQISVDGGATWSLLYDSIHNNTGFIPANVDLTPFSGTVVNLRFLFDTIDACCNAQEGAYIDNIAFVP